MFITALQNIRRHIKLQVTCGLGICRVRGGEMITPVMREEWCWQPLMGGAGILSGGGSWTLTITPGLSLVTLGNTEPSLVRGCPPMMGGGQ